MCPQGIFSPACGAMISPHAAGTAPCHRARPRRLTIVGEWMDDFGWAFGALGLVVGGILKGATGAGAPLLAVPLLVIFYDVQTAIAALTVPSLLANLWQAWLYRAAQSPFVFVAALAGAAAVGAVAGSILLVTLPAGILLASVGAAVFVYIGFRLSRPQWVMGPRMASILVAPAGFVGGILQGAVGISAPVSLTFLNAMRMERAQFIATVSVFFAAMSAVQIPALVGVGVMTAERAVMSLAACIPLFGAMPLGAFLARHISRETFDKLMLVILAVVATRLLVEALAF